MTELRSRRTELERQRSRVRDALEEAMCRGDRFDVVELRSLLEHPRLAPALSRLVLIGDGVAGCLVAVHSQHCGRLFLPFADDDPRTAEVLSKVLLLARDREIRDPNILEWIRAAKHGVVVS